MRTPRRIKQPLIYALLKGKEPIYERDKEGNIVYKIIGGEKIPKTTGEKRDVYSAPITFYNSISGDLTENEVQAFGVQNNANAVLSARPLAAHILIERFLFSVRRSRPFQGRSGRR